MAKGFFILLIGIVIFLVCREFVCWYCKINRIVSNQDEIIRLLKKIAGENNVASDNEYNEVTEDTEYTEYNEETE